MLNFLQIGTFCYILFGNLLALYRLPYNIRSTRTLYNVYKRDVGPIPGWAQSTLVLVAVVCYAYFWYVGTWPWRLLEKHSLLSEENYRVQIEDGEPVFTKTKKDEK
jgi:hypothetical protein